MLSKQRREKERAHRRRRRERRAQLEASSGEAPSYMRFDEEPVEFLTAAATVEGQPAVRKFRMKAYGGGKMRPSGFYHDCVVDLTGLKILAGHRPAFLEHDRHKIVGHLTTIEIDGGVQAEGVASGAGSATREVLESAANGFPWKASIGGPIEKLVFVEAAEQAEANGRQWTGPLYIVRAMTLAEISFVSLAGDNTSSAKITAGSTGKKSENNSMNFDAWLQAKGFDAATITDQQAKFLKAMFEAEQEPATQPATVAASQATGQSPVVTQPPAPTQLAATSTPPAATPGSAEELVASLRRAGAAESQRQTRIREIAATYGPQQVTVEGQQVDLVAHAIEQGWDVAQTELTALRAARPQHGRESHGSSSAGIAAETLEAALCLSAGLGEEIASQGVSERAMNEASGRSLRSAGIHTLMYEVIRAAGGYVRPGQIDTEFLEAALAADRQLAGNGRHLQAAAGFATVSLSGILGNVANKSLLKSFTAVEPVVHEFCGTSDLTNFHPHTRYRLTGDGTLLEVGADGELKSFELDQESYTNQAKTFGRLIQLTRQMMINDDLGAFLQIPMILGRGAALALNKAVFTLLLSPGSFFSAGNSNYFEGGDSNLQISSLTTGEKLFLEQEDAQGNPIALTPGVLLVPPAEKVNAEQLYSDRFVNETTTANKGKPNGNPHAGKFKPVSSPYLSAQGLTGQSNTAWYLLANPADVPVMEIGYLRGQQTPTMQTGEADFKTLGMYWRAFWDFGVAMANKQAGVKSKGAA